MGTLLNYLTLLHAEWSKLYRVLTVLSAIGLYTREIVQDVLECYIVFTGCMAGFHTG